jgi:uncharacterized protein YbjT (DUF2867 family)
MVRIGTALVAGVETPHGQVYTLALVAGGYRVRGLVAGSAAERVAALGVQPVSVDLSDPGAVRRLVDDVDAVVIALNGRGAEGRTDEERTTRTLLETAASAHVPTLYSSLLHAERQTGVPALDLKGRLELVARRSGAPVTVLRPGLLMDAFDDRAVRERALAHGVLESAVSVDAPVSYLAPDDLGILAVLALEADGLREATLDLGGPQAVTIRDLIPQLWRLTGHSVTYEQQSLDGWWSPSSEEEARLARHINDEGYAVDMEPLLERLPVRLTTLAEYLADRGWAARLELAAA